MNRARSRVVSGKRPKVFVDTNVLKFAATRLKRLRPRIETIEFDGWRDEVQLHDIVEINPNERIRNPELKAEADLLPQLAHLGTEMSVEFVIQLEAELESWGLPDMDSLGGRFYGCPLTLIDGPFRYSRVLFGGDFDAEERQFRFLTSIQEARFLELQKVTGAYQGSRPIQRNQLLDAFHLWCAEHAQCDYFLTLDFRLAKMVNGRTNVTPVQLVKPSELLACTR